jgi:hypothetical protein
MAKTQAGADYAELAQDLEVIFRKYNNGRLWRVKDSVVRVVAGMVAGFAFAMMAMRPSALAKMQAGLSQIAERD